MKATIFGGAYTLPHIYEETLAIGKILAEEGYDVKSGGYFGLMEAISKGATDNGGLAIGYTCKSFPSTKGNQYLTETIVNNDVYERLKGLISNSDLFIVLHGGIGTLSELFLTLDVVRKMKTPIPVLLIGEVWTKVMEPMSLLIGEKELKLFTIIEDYTQLKNKISRGSLIGKTPKSKGKENASEGI